MNKITEYDQKQAYDTTIKPLVEELVRQCFLAGIPCFFTAATVNTKDHTEYETDGYFTGSSSYVLADDHIKHCLMIHDGFVARPPRDNIDDDINAFLDDGMPE